MNEIEQIIKYFNNFDYIPTTEEIYTFYPKKINMDTVGEYYKKNQKLKIKSQKFQKEREKRKRISENKINLINTYIKLLSNFSQIKLVGLSGTVAMNNAQENDDIDLFIITAKDRLWTGRLVAILLAQLLNLRRKRNSNNVIASESCLADERGNLVTKKTVYINGIVSLRLRRVRLGFAQGKLPRNYIKVKDKVCLNLFFDENNLQVPKYKQTEYVAHEVLQIKPLINKDQVYERFLKANEWTFVFFPNAAEDFRGLKADFHKYQRKSAMNLWKSISNKIEQMLKSFQLLLIRKHKTTEIITDSQLWFFPEDYERKMQGLSQIKRADSR